MDHNLFVNIVQKPNLKDYKGEFAEAIINENMRRSKIISVILIGVIALLIVFDLLVYKPMWNFVPQYVNLFYSHLLVFSVLMLWLALLCYKKDCCGLLCKKAFNYTFYSVVIAWCTFMGVNSVNVTGSITAYIICMFCFAACFLKKPLVALFAHCASAVVIISALFAFVNNNGLLYSNVVNVVITIILTQIIAIINYSFFLNDYLNKKQILKGKEELEAVNQKLKEYENLRTDFFANISHELRTPLNVIYSAEQMLDITMKCNRPDPEKINKYNKMIKQNTYRLLRLINNLIDITKIDTSNFSLKLTNINIVSVIESIAVSVADFVEDHGITLTFDTEIEEKVIACDPDIIERVILNLLSNAVKYVDSNGSVYVNVFLKDSYVCVSVRDTGIGISEEMKSMIFQRFIQADKSLKRMREGSGIGLSLVKSLVDMHNGDIIVNSKLGEGSEFIVKLPDIKVSEGEEIAAATIQEEKFISRINIEFSDIYR